MKSSFTQWTRGESNPCPKAHPSYFYKLSLLFDIPSGYLQQTKSNLQQLHITPICSKLCISRFPHSRCRDSGVQVHRSRQVPNQATIANFSSAFIFRLEFNALPCDLLLRIQNPRRNLYQPIYNLPVNLADILFYKFLILKSRSFSLRTSFFAIESRLSYNFIPITSPIQTLHKPFLIYTCKGIIVQPFSLVFPESLLISDL